jgi:protoporphyrinogen/coproporphyrinogen III oxidase
VPGSPSPTVAVVGAGVTGLLTARHLADGGASVTVLEASSRVGGQILTAEVSGVRVDLGAEALHVTSPELCDLLARLDLEDELVTARTGTTWVATGRGLRRLPAGMGPAGPTKLWPVVRSRVLSPRGLLRAACEPLVPGAHPGEDVAVGSYLSRRFGPELTDRLVDPLLGNLHAGDVRRLSLASTVPHLDGVARRSRSVVLDRRGRPPGSPPRFATLAGGLARLTDRLAADPRVTVRRDHPVTALVAGGRRYEVRGPGRASLDADAVVLAVPAAVATRLLRPLDPRAATLLDRQETASVATAILTYPREHVRGGPLAGGTGLLVPSGTRRTLKAATVLSRRWPHLDEGDTVRLRVSAGRAGEERLAWLSDHELLHELRRDLAELAGLTAAPTEVLLQRWPETMPQLVVGHRAAVAEARERLDADHRIHLAGAPYDGVGIASCVRSAGETARRVLATSPVGTPA